MYEDVTFNQLELAISYFTKKNINISQKISSLTKKNSSHSVTFQEHNLK